MRPPSLPHTRPCPGTWTAHALPHALRNVVRRLRVRWSHDVVVVSVARQRLSWFTRETTALGPPAPPAFRLRASYRASTSAFGIGQIRDSQRTPLGLHRVAAKVGGGWPVGTVFKFRQPVGFVWQGMPNATIAHRILWLEGLEPGHNRGGIVDTRSRYIYIHGLADEPTLGRPASHGCIHLSGTDLIRFFDRVGPGTLVWITAGP